LKKYYELNPGLFTKLFHGNGGRILKAVDGINFDVNEREILGIAGESGCGKTTTGMILAKLIKPSAGKIFFVDQDITDLSKKEIKNFRKAVQFIFQDPYQSLNPRFTTFDLIAEPLRAMGICQEQEIPSRVIKTLKLIGLNPDEFMQRFPHQMSGGERQRVGIGSAIVVEPQFVIADEPVSMLDVSIRAGILDLIRNLSRELNFTCIYISHDLASIASISDRLMIMYLGKIVEMGRTKEIIENCFHPYSKALMAATPVPDPKHKRNRVNIKGWISKPIDLPPGCRFEPRCSSAIKKCSLEMPNIIEIENGHTVACHLYK
jgi:oligopeptide/dipeptide ABC transporter ATP-binding protein